MKTTEGAVAAGQDSRVAAAALAAGDAAEAALGTVTSRLPGGEVRPQQIAMARAVAAALAADSHLVVQAGTGTGKSLAYAVPVALSGRKVVVATATKALQDQLATKDLPAVVDGLERPVSFAVLKGRNNYLCRQRAAELQDKGFQQQLTVDDEAVGTNEMAEAGAGADDADPGRLADQVMRILRWAATSDTGDRGDLPFEPHHRAWAMLSVGPRECPGAFRCPQGGSCFTERARDRAAAADIVVVNTHLYGAHLASGGAVLPEHQVVVFDEAQEVEAVMTAALGTEVTPGRLRALAALARPLLAAGGTGNGDGPGAAGRATEGGEAATARLTEALDHLADELQELLGEQIGQRVLDSGPAAGSDHSDGDARLSQLLELAAARTGALSERLHAIERPQGTESELAARALRAVGAAGHLVEDLGRFAKRGEDDVPWVDGIRRAPVLRLSPIDVGPTLASLLWGEVAAVLTSATIPLRLPEQLGLPPGSFDQRDVGSPFDFRNHGLLYVARHLPDPRRRESERQLHDELHALITAAGGRTLALFTSRRATEAAVAALRPLLPFQVLAQGDRPKGRLLETFARDEASCLFATMGFWQGVDVPGRALTLVTLDRLPFGRPDDPLLEARRERAGEAAFRLIDLPRAATLLAQGAGRLIRSADDFGVVAVLDPRLATAGYRRVLLAATPPFRRTVERRQVEDFLRRVLTPP